MRITITTASVVAGIGASMLVGCAVKPTKCKYLEPVANTAQIRSLFIKYQEPIVVVDDKQAYYCGCGPHRKLGGDTEGKIGGMVERTVEGMDESRKHGGDEESRSLGGRSLGGKNKGLACLSGTSCNMYAITGESLKIEVYDGATLQPAKNNSCLF